MTRRAALDEAQMTPFARMIYDYLLSSRPNKLVADLAYETGINNQTIWDWLRKGVIPRRATITELSHKTGMPLDELLHAAGLPTDAEVARERIGHARVARTLARRYEVALDQLTSENPAFTEQQRALLRRWAREELPAVLMRGDDLRDELLREVEAAGAPDGENHALNRSETPETPETHGPR
jgi:transcriptional regulator with XRE-family HTH domain